MAKSEFAPGLPDPRRFGHPKDLPLNQILDYVVQEHNARRAGKHLDVRMGPNLGNKPTMMSWATKHPLPQPGEKRMLFQQPLHQGSYSDFEGTLISGYGAGTVKTHDRGKVLVTKVTPDKISFVVIHKKHPEMYTLIRRSGPPASPRTAREMRTQGGEWLLINTSPREAIKHNKIHYTKVPASEIGKLFDKDYLHEAKLDGSAALFKLLSDRIEVLSYRPTTKGRPIVHTYRVGGTTNVDIPKHLVGSVLRGELYGVRTPTGRAIPPQELGGLLNASTLRSLEEQRKRNIELKNMVFNVLQYGKTPVDIEEPFEARMTKLREIMQHLPKNKFTLPEVAGTPEEQQKLWEQVAAGKHPLTQEGIVAWPRAGGKPTKVKLTEDHDVYVREIFPGKGKLQGTGAGGFKYSLTPTGGIVGEVGTGFTEATRKQMWETPEEYVGRIARIKVQSQFPSGAFRAPSYLSLHEDYPAVKAATLLKHAQPTEYVEDPEQMLLREQYAGMASPTSLRDALAYLASMGVQTGAIGTATALGSAGLSRLGLIPSAGPLGKAIAAKWAPKALAGTVGNWLGIGAGRAPLIGPLISAALEGAGGLTSAYGDPRYQAGEYGYGRAALKQLGRMGEAGAAKAHEAYDNGLLSGAGTSALQGLIRPLSTVTGFGQALWRVNPFAKHSSVLAPAITKMAAALGGSGNTMAALTNAAQTANTPKATWSDWLRGKLLGLKPEEVMRLREGLSTAATWVDKLKQLKEQVLAAVQPQPTAPVTVKT